MKEDLFDFFNEKLSGKGLIFNFIKVWYYGFLVLTIILGITGIPSLILLRKPLYQGITFIVFFLMFTGVICIFNYRTKKFLKDIYNVIPKKFMWNGSKFQSLRRKMLNEYLRSKSLLTSKKITTLIEMYNRDAYVIKVSIPVIPSVFALLFIPLWNNLISWIYKQSDVNTFNQAIEVFGSVFLIILMVTALVMMVKSALGSMLEDIMNSEYRKMKSLCKMLEDIKFDIDLSIEDKEKDLN